jgi:hypothetical protein
MTYRGEGGGGGVDVWIHIFLTLALVRGEWPVSRPCRFTTKERTSSTHCIGGWVGPRASLHYLERRSSWPYQDTNSDPSVIQLIARHYSN